MADIKFLPPQQEDFSAITTALGIANAVNGLVNGLNDRSNKQDERALAKRKLDLENTEKLQKDSYSLNAVSPMIDYIGKGLLPATPEQIAAGQPKVDPKTGLQLPVSKDAPVLINLNVPDQSAQGFKPIPFVQKAGPLDELGLGLALKKQQLEKGQKELSQGSADERKAADFANRLDLAERDFGDLKAKGFDPTSLSSRAQGFDPTGLLSSEDVKRQSQAERNFVNSVLRRESGSAISKDEFKSAELQYFPRSGDSPAVLAQKARSREQARLGLIKEAGNAYAPLPQRQNAAPQPSKTSSPLDSISLDDIDSAIIKKQGIKSGVKK